MTRTSGARKHAALFVLDRANERPAQSLRRCRHGEQDEGGQKQQTVSTHMTHPHQLGNVTRPSSEQFGSPGEDEANVTRVYPTGRRYGSEGAPASSKRPWEALMPSNAALASLVCAR